jgi:hypothetical protein
VTLSCSLDGMIRMPEAGGPTVGIPIGVE